MTRTGILLCTCDQKIGKGIDVDAVAAALHGADFVTTLPHICLPDGKQQLKREIVENNLDRVVIAACPARFQEKNLRDTCVEAGINPNLFQLVDWREGCAGAHRGDKEGATARATDLVQMGLARASNAEPIDGVLTQIVPHVLVIGGGIAGMTAARTVAERGIDVTLVERANRLGGEEIDNPAYQETREAVLNNSRIQLLLNSQVAAVHGTVGHYHVEIAGALGIDDLEAGAVIIAIGAQEYRDARWYHHDGRRVVTLGAFEKQIADGNGTTGPVIYILCAGSRDENISYCSNTCCLASLNQAIRCKRANPAAEVTVLFRDLYLLGDELNEEVVRDARRAGISFIRYPANRPPRVEEERVRVTDTSGTIHQVKYDRVVLATPQVPRDDAGLLARLFHLPRDEDGFFLDPHYRVRPEQQHERGLYICGSAHRPVDVDTAIFQGMTAAARAARFIRERQVMQPALSAQVNPSLCTGCAQCAGTCDFAAIHMTGAFATAQIPGNGHTLDRATIDPFLCQACGNCVVACPSKAIDLPGSCDAQIFAQIDAALGGHGEAEAGRRGEMEMSVARVIAFACHWSGLAAMELAGARRLKYPANVRTIELPCSARLDPMHVLYALMNGADTVMLALCPPDECHYGKGNRDAEARIENLRAQLAAHGIDPSRLVVSRMMGDDANAWVKAIEQVADKLQVAGIK